jgi:hypothetical protein
VGFAGMTMKTDDDGDAHMQGVSLHDNYIQWYRQWRPVHR